MSPLSSNQAGLKIYLENDLFGENFRRCSIVFPKWINGINLFSFDIKLIRWPSYRSFPVQWLLAFFSENWIYLGREISKTFKEFCLVLCWFIMTFLSLDHFELIKTRNLLWLTGRNEIFLCLSSYIFVNRRRIMHFVSINSSAFFVFLYLYVSFCFYLL